MPKLATSFHPKLDSAVWLTVADMGRLADIAAPVVDIAGGIVDVLTDIVRVYRPALFSIRLRNLDYSVLCHPSAWYFCYSLTLPRSLLTMTPDIVYRQFYVHA